MRKLNKGRTQEEWSLMINFAETRKIAERFGFACTITETIYRAIRKFKSNTEHTAFPELSTIADESGHCKNTVIKHIRILEGLGVVMKQRRKRCNKKGILRDTSNLYTFTAEKLGKAVQNSLARRGFIILDEGDKEPPAQRKLTQYEMLDWVKDELIGFGEYTKRQINKVYVQVKEEMQKGTHIQSVSSYVYRCLENLAEFDVFRQVERERRRAIRDYNAGRRDAFSL